MTENQYNEMIMFCREDSCMFCEYIEICELLDNVDDGISFYDKLPEDSQKTVDNLDVSNLEPFKGRV